MPDWKEYARVGDLRAVIDPFDLKGYKNHYINLLHHVILSDAMDKDLKGKKVLDLGCGIGRFTEFLKSRGAEVVGLDSCQEMLDFNTGCKTVCSPVTSLPFKDGEFDIILSVWTLQYLDDNDLQTAVSEMIRVLAPGGMVYLIEQMTLFGYDTVIPRIPHFYNAVFSKRCVPVDKRSICYAFDRTISLVRIGLLSPTEKLARWHLPRTRNLTFREYEYVDYFMSFKKEDSK